ncbi:general secretion pathway protein GspK [Corticibacter populi]|uniref:Type II secretion system protein K n=1 Tax=Corticibacter populi TaxID=1550736 RepID=A0A3M6QP59_9BURK|nr:type II secretion system minor pseudopilin GspK [Corticibacter populi]RMX04850.1 general secretion pathway protein GspK [Corticibacter populi]RZS33729.1 general secretion pathway protein K [Corticibacter populi]
MRDPVGSPVKGSISGRMGAWHGRRRQRGAALLLAMLIVALVASLAATASWRQWSSVQAEADERAQLQAHALTRGALDWAKIIMHLDGRFTRNDNLNEPWAVPLAEAKIGPFLAAEGNVAQDANANMGEAFFAGSISDLQGRLNLSNLVSANAVDAQVQQQFERLFEALGLPPEQVARLAQRYLASLQADPDADVPLTPLCTEQLPWLGLTTEQVQLLRPYVTVLPTRTRLNLNTAPELVLWAALGGEPSTAARMVAVRSMQPFENLDAAQALAGPGVQLDANAFGVGSDYFLVSGQLRLDTLETLDRFILYRSGSRLTTVRRACEEP